ncbi:SDR family NAD(P)-dependent oxidoreductase [Devosia psychrophila]|uniref:3-oxoacyl-[acyl-carrier protein] reductase n=2 Tax=Devosia psychrophila TaxID=728005 RepID=A0A1I1R4F0_9HYPH|nr:SDR family oxidoreductase [Devosia psychrophila]SFD29132.1 3-oxoacyl-[acyl-carrier protein] reductase [Devosia psychrophila]
MDRRVALVTGAAGGMGRAIVDALIRDGIACYGADIDAKALDEMGDSLGANFLALPVDLTQPDAIADAFSKVQSRHGGLDILVNNAGTCLMSDFPNITAAELDRQMAINFSSAFHCAQNAVKLMQGRSGVRKIVNISSNGAYNFDVFDPPHYRASKAAMDSLTKDLARRFAADRISVNSIAPAMTETPLFKVLTQDVLDRAIAQMPHGRAMQPSEIAEWVRFLVSSAGDISSGNVIILNQGRDVR